MRAQLLENDFLSVKGLEHDWASEDLPIATERAARALLEHAMAAHPQKASCRTFPPATEMPPTGRRCQIPRRRCGRTSCSLWATLLDLHARVVQVRARFARRICTSSPRPCPVNTTSSWRLVLFRASALVYLPPLPSRTSPRCAPLPETGKLHV
jgi:hypothetical protein